MPFTQDPPEWFFITTGLVMLGIMIGLLIWGVVLELRYINPFMLIKTSNKEKWRKAAVLALLQTSMLPIFGLAMPILSTPPEKLPMFLFCNGLWIVALPLAILYKRWEFERHIKNYRFLDKIDKREEQHVSARLYEQISIKSVEDVYVGCAKAFFQ